MHSFTYLTEAKYACSGSSDDDDNSQKNKQIRNNALQCAGQSATMHSSEYANNYYNTGESNFVSLDKPSTMSNV